MASLINELNLGPGVFLQFFDDGSVILVLPTSKAIAIPSIGIGGTVFGQVAAGSQWSYDGSGNLICTFDGTLTIGNSAANRPKSIFLAGPSITPQSATGLIVNNSGELRRLIYKTTLTFQHAAFIAAAATADVTIGALPAKTRLVGVISDTTQAWAGLGGTISLILGKTVGGAEYVATHDVKTAAVTKGLADADLGTALVRAAAIQGGDLPSWTVNTNVSARITSGAGNIGTGAVTNLTAGSTTFYLITEAHP